MQESDQSFDTPILFIVFSRPETTIRVFEEIRRIRPKRLFVAADGPRENKEGEAEKCQKVREIALGVDWPCEVNTLLRDENFGCGKAPSEAITWFFEHVEEGIILEDDTLPGPGFFQFCSELLEKYREDTRIMAISGFCLPDKVYADEDYSYYFSNWDFIWGWATWKRAWKYFDYKVRHYGHLTEHGYFGKNYYSIHESYFVNYVYDRSFYENEKVSWWDPQWGISRKANSGLVVVPNKNMVLNLGIGQEGATNTVDKAMWPFLKFEKMDFPLKHPDFLMLNHAKEASIFRQNFTNQFIRIKGHIKKSIPKSFLKSVRKLTKD